MEGHKSRVFVKYVDSPFHHVQVYKFSVLFLQSYVETYKFLVQGTEYQFLMEGLEKKYFGVIFPLLGK